MAKENTIGKRIQTIRKAQVPKLNQGQFGEILGATRDMIASYEKGSVTPKPPFIQLICLKFNVNETWLLTGEGEPYIKNEEAIIEEQINAFCKSSEMMRLAKAFFKFPAERRNLVLELLKEFSDNYELARKSGRKMTDLQEEEKQKKCHYQNKLQQYNQQLEEILSKPDDEKTTSEKRIVMDLELDAEEKGITSSVSTTTNGLSVLERKRGNN